MGPIRTTATIRNPAAPSRSWTGTFLADTGVVDSLAPRPHLEGIGLAPGGQRVYETADGHETRMDVTIGEIEIMGS